MRFRALMLTPAVLATVPGVAQELPAQKEHRADFRRSSDEVHAVVEEFYAHDEALPLDVHVAEEWEEEGARYESLVFTTQSNERVPGDLVLPLDADRPVPAVLLLHGLGSNRDRWWKEDREPLPKGLLAAGIAVFAIDLRHHGARQATNDYTNPVYLTFGNELFIQGRDMTIDSTIDARRALDLLAARDDIDGERLGVVGYSMGAMIALYLSALEPSLDVVVAAAVPTTEQAASVDHFNFAARAKAPILLQIGRTDWLSSPADVERLRDIVPSGATLRYYDAGHKLPPAFGTDAAGWLGEILR